MCTNSLYIFELSGIVRRSTGEVDAKIITAPAGTALLSNCFTIIAVEELVMTEIGIPIVLDVLVANRCRESFGAVNRRPG
jgi:hypothetical protein